MAMATLVIAIDFTAFSVSMPSGRGPGRHRTVTRVGTRPAPHHEGAARRLGHHRLVHNRDA
jgi:hypothetical protein